MIMSDTPKTDAVAIPPHHSVTSDYSQLEIHARALERENAKLRDALKKIVQGGYGPGSDIAHPAIGVARNALFS